MAHESETRAAVLVLGISGSAPVPALEALPAIEIVHASSPAEAGLALKERGFAAVLVTARDARELEVARGLRAQAPETPLLLLGVRREERGLVEAARALGTADILCEPLEVPLLLARVELFAALFRKDAELRLTWARLEERQLELDQLFSDAPSFMALLGLPDYRFEKANEKLYQVVGRRDLIGRRMLEALPELEDQGFISALDEVVRTGKPFVGTEVPVMFEPAGQQKLAYVDYIYQPLRRADGQLSAIAVLGYDVTEQVLSRKAVENERENFRNLFKQTPEMVCILKGPEHVFEFVNEAHIRALGFDATGMAVRTAQPESVEVHGILDEVYRTGKTAELHEIPVTVTDRLRYFNLTYAARRDDAGQINGVMILGVEVTDQVAAREKLEESQRRLLAALNARDEFLSIASHELKTPMTSLRLQLELTGRQIKPEQNLMPDPKRLARVIQISTAQVARLSSLVEDLLDVTRIQTGKLSLTFETHDLTEIVQGVAERFAEALSSAGCELELIGSGPVPVWCDRFRMEQVVVNLLSNAMKYGAGKPVKVEVASAGELGRVTVRDFGIGIEKAQQARVFERFERAVTSRNISGLGLGLYIARQIVEAHHGTIRVESTPGEGATFTVELPRQAPAA